MSKRTQTIKYTWPPINKNRQSRRLCRKEYRDQIVGILRGMRDEKVMFHDTFLEVPIYRKGIGKRYLRIDYENIEKKNIFEIDSDHSEDDGEPRPCWIHNLHLKAIYEGLNTLGLMDLKERLCISTVSQGGSWSRLIVIFIYQKI